MAGFETRQRLSSRLASVESSLPERKLIGLSLIGRRIPAKQGMPPGHFAALANPPWPRTDQASAARRIGRMRGSMQWATLKRM